SLDRGSATRAQVLRQIAESAEVYSGSYNQAFVVMEYFGYLHRDPDVAYLTWLDELNRTGDPRRMIAGFVNSSEYRARSAPLLNYPAGYADKKKPLATKRYKRLKE